jgi:hypothetical protein
MHGSLVTRVNTIYVGVDRGSYVWDSLILDEPILHKRTHETVGRICKSLLCRSYRSYRTCHNVATSCVACCHKRTISVLVRQEPPFPYYFDCIFKSFASMCAGWYSAAARSKTMATSAQL